MLIKIFSISAKLKLRSKSTRLTFKKKKKFTSLVIIFLCGNINSHNQNCT